MLTLFRRRWVACFRGPRRGRNWRWTLKWLVCVWHTGFVLVLSDRGCKELWEQLFPDDEWSCVDCSCVNPDDNDVLGFRDNSNFFLEFINVSWRMQKEWSEFFESYHANQAANEDNRYQSSPLQTTILLFFWGSNNVGLVIVGRLTLFREDQ